MKLETLKRPAVSREGDRPISEDPAFRAGLVAGEIRKGRPIRLLSLWQPWAQLVAIGAKSFETRTWTTSYRGLVAIHAARTTAGILSMAPPLRELLRERWRHEIYLPTGAIVAVCELRRTLPTSRETSKAEIAALSDVERACGDFGPQRFAWEFQLVGTLEQPIPYRGAQGLRALPYSVALKVAKGLRPVEGS